MRLRIFGLLVALIMANGCLTTRVAQPQPDRITGLASWYGQEFAGRTTANGEIFDPALLTAAHRSLPFGTLLEVHNPANGKNVQVRVNDRGPFVGNRIIDLSYAAAAELGMVETGVGKVEIRVLKIGAGDREPPAPIVVRAGDPVRTIPRQTTTSAPPPTIEFPLPSDVSGIKTAEAAPEPAPPAVVSEPEVATVERVEVEEIRAGTAVRKQVADDGRTIVKTPDPNAPPERPATRPSAVRPAPAVKEPRFILQLGAFQSEANASELARKAREIAPNVYVELFKELHRVRIGPFKTRESAIEMKEKLDVAELPSIVVTE